MKMKWWDSETNKAREVMAPLTVVISAFSIVRNIHNTWTPQLRRQEQVGETVLLLVDLAAGHRALGGSALAQVFGKLGNEVPDVRNGESWRSEQRSELTFSPQYNCSRITSMQLSNYTKKDLSSHIMTFQTVAFSQRLLR